MTAAASNGAGAATRVVPAGADQRAATIDFLRRCWRADHLFVRDPAWFDWQHGAPGAGGYDALLALDGGDRIVGFLGLLPFDDAPAPGARDLGTGVWVAAPDAPRGAGLALFRTLQAGEPRYVGALGVNAGARAVLRLLGHRGGIARHFYVANPAVAPRLASGLTAPAAGLRAGPALSLHETADPDALAATRQAALPAKDPAWRRWRYLTGAPFAYRFFSVRARGATDPVFALVAREIAVEGGRCLRLVEMQGDPAAVPGLGALLAELIAAEGLEYADLLIGGDDLDWIATDWGFVERQGAAMLPVHVDPLLRETVEIGWTLRAPPGALAWVMRGDADQDRPNRPGPAAPPRRGAPAPGTQP